MDRMTAAERASLFYNDTETWQDARGYSLSDRLWRNGQAARRQIDAVLRDAIRTGRSIEDTATELEQYLDPAFQTAGKAHYPATRLAGNETRRAHARGEHAVARTDPAGGYLRFETSATHIDQDECTDIANHNEGFGRGVYPARDCPLPPIHIGCFPSGTVVSAEGVVKAYKRWWDGELVEVLTSDGHFLSVTPNHPVLTPQGWVAAGLLNEGDEVVSHGGRQRELDSVQPDHNYGPAPIEQIAETLQRRGLVVSVTVPTSAVDFHGDGVDGEVNIVSTDSLLRGGDNASFSKPRLQHLFRWRYVGAVTLACQRHLAALFVRMFTPRGQVGRPKHLPPFFGAHPVHAKLLRLASVPWLDAMSSQACGDRPSTYTIGRRKRFDRFPVLESLNDLFVRDGKRCTASLSRPLVTDVFGFFRIAKQAASMQLPVKLSLPHMRRLRAEVKRFSRLVQANRALHLVCLFANLLVPYSSLHKLTPNDSLRDVPPGSGIDVTHTGQIVVDRVIKTSRRVFSGHVYNLETRDGYYIANNIIVHNCRCSVSRIPLAARGMDDFVDRLRVEYELEDPPDLSPGELRIFRRETAGIRNAVKFMFSTWFQQTGLVTPAQMVADVPTVAGWIARVRAAKGWV